jgi:hypothetical protein
MSAAVEEAKPPNRFCTRCREPIDPKRVMRGSSFCSNECRKADLNKRRDYRASKACRLCGRPPKRKTTPKADISLCDGSTRPTEATGAEPATPKNEILEQHN